MKKTAGFSLVEMVIATALFAAGSLLVYTSFTGVTRSSRAASVRIDLGAENKRALTRIYNELQASSSTAQKIENLPVAAFEPEEVNPDGTVNTLMSGDDAESPPPVTVARIVDRSGATTATLDVDTWDVGAGQTQARERVMPRSSWLRFRKVTGYFFNGGEISPEWSTRVQYRVNNERKLVRSVAGGRERVVANDVDVFHVDQTNPDGTVLVTLVTAKPDPNGDGWRRYANTLTVNPKN